MDQVICSRDVVVSVGFDALNRIIAVKAMLVLHALEYELVVGHLLLPWVEAEYSFLFVHFEPGVLSYFIYSGTGLWVGVQNLSEEVGAFRGDEFRYGVVCTQYLLVEI